MTLVVPAVVAGLCAPSEELPRRPERPFTVFILATPRGDPEAEKRVHRSAKHLRKALGARKEWFKVVARREEAEILVEVQAHWIEETWRSLPEGYSYGVGKGSVIAQHHYVQAKLNVLGEELGLSGADERVNGSERGAASALAKELENLCRKYHWALRVKRRAPRPPYCP